jgi:hypothetical protein
MLEVEQVLSEIQNREVFSPFGSGRVVDAHETVRKRMLGILENMVHVPLVAEEMSLDASMNVSRCGLSRIDCQKLRRVSSGSSRAMRLGLPFLEFLYCCRTR